MLEKNIKIKAKNGMHFRPLSLVVKAARAFKSNVFIELDDDRADCKNAFSLQNLDIEYDSLIKLITDGEDQTEALNYMELLLRELK